MAAVAVPLAAVALASLQRLTFVCVWAVAVRLMRLRLAGQRPMNWCITLMTMHTRRLTSPLTYSRMGVEQRSICSRIEVVTTALIRQETGFSVHWCSEIDLIRTLINTTCRLSIVVYKQDDHWYLQTSEAIWLRLLRYCIIIFDRFC